MGTTRNHNRIVRPQVEATVSLSITAKLMKFTARQDFTVGNCQVKAGETCFAVQSGRRPGRFYIVRFNTERATYQCSCGANTCEHEHLKTTREHVMSTVVAPESSPMTVPATSAQVRVARKAKVEQTSEPFDGSRPITATEYKEIVKRDKARQKAEKAADWAKIEEARKQALAG